LPKNSESAELTIYASSSNSTIMDSTKVGNGHGRAIADSSRERKSAAVAVDYFTKWAEAKALVNITAPTVQKFFW
jgi:hypothetical protein